MNEKKDQPPSDTVKSSEPTHYTHHNFNINDVFNTPFSSWGDSWILDFGSTCHMTFRRDFFKTFSDDLDGVFTLLTSLKLNHLELGLFV